MDKLSSNFHCHVRKNCKSHMINFGCGGTQNLMKKKDNSVIYGVKFISLLLEPPKKVLTETGGCLKTNLQL